MVEFNLTEISEEGERIIAEYLQNNKIEFQYLPEFRLPGDVRDQPWNPSFYLPDHRIIIEYSNMASLYNTAKNETKKAQKVCEDNNLRFIPLNRDLCFEAISEGGLLKQITDNQ